MAQTFLSAQCAVFHRQTGMSAPPQCFKRSLNEILDSPRVSLLLCISCRHQRLERTLNRRRLGAGRRHGAGRRLGAGRRHGAGRLRVRRASAGATGFQAGVAESLVSTCSNVTSLTAFGLSTRMVHVGRAFGFSTGGGATVATGSSVSAVAPPVRRCPSEI